MRLQPNDYSCGPIAILNAYYYKYKCFPNISLKKLCNRCLTNEEIGTERWNMNYNNIIDLGKSIYNKQSIIEMSAFILLYSFGEKYAHYVFVERKKDKYFIYNYCDESSDNYINVVKSKEEFEDLIRANPKVDELDYPLAWVV